MKFKRIRYHRMFEVRHLFNYTPSHARLAFSRLLKVGVSAATIPCPRNYSREARLLS